MRNCATHYLGDWGIGRRDFLRLSSLSLLGFITGCAVNPVTGKSQLMLMSEEDEVAIDKKYSPYQFSADYGFIQDNELNNYIQKTGKKLASNTHRKNMPYNFHAVNAVYVNAYAFPGGSIACTRGILLSLEDEAELAALLGHELGHVNARHTAEQMSKGQLTSSVFGGLAAIVSLADSSLGSLAAGLGNIGAGALLAKYSRDNEREADSLGMEYMVKSSYNPDGMVELMDVLRKMSKSDHNLIELMFATHPMSNERYNDAVQRLSQQYRDKKNSPHFKERYMDNTTKLRSLKPAIIELQNGEASMAKKEYNAAEEHFKKALKFAPEDYAALIMMSQYQMTQKKYKEAKQYAQNAKDIYKGEPQANYIIGNTSLLTEDYERALEEFRQYDKILPGNPDIIFLKGYSYEKMDRKKEAAEEYYKYLQKVNRGEKAQHAYNRLVEWGYVKS